MPSFFGDFRLNHHIPLHALTLYNQDHEGASKGYRDTGTDPQLRSVSNQHRPGRVLGTEGLRATRWHRREDGRRPGPGTRTRDQNSSSKRVRGDFSGRETGSENPSVWSLQRLQGNPENQPRRERRPRSSASMHR